MDEMLSNPSAFRPIITVHLPSSRMEHHRAMQYDVYVTLDQLHSDCTWPYVESYACVCNDASEFNQAQTQTQMRHTHKITAKVCMSLTDQQNQANQL